MNPTSSRAIALLCMLAGMCSSLALATPLEDLRQATVSELEFGSFKLELALTGLKDWPAPIEGASVSYQIDPDQIQILVALKKKRTYDARSLCARTLARVREFLYVDADGTPRMGRSYLNSYFQGRWQGLAREPALRALDAATSIRVDVVGEGTCRAPLIKGAVTFEPLSAK